MHYLDYNVRMLKVYNTLSRSVEDFEPLNPPNVGMYSCGPTVYDFAHIGHMRTYVGTDILIRTLKMNRFDVKQVMNITDVGHLVSDSDTGEDKMEKGAKKFGMSVWDIAEKFEKQFFDSTDLLNIKRPPVVMKATDYIQDQIELIQILEEKGFTYKIRDGIYFDTSKFPDYNKLSRQNLDELKAGARIEMSLGKKHPTDFALWKFSKSDEKRQMEWESPWGKGFPGWHIECSAMSIKELGWTFDLHTGGIDHIMVHHTNEIAQSEAASGKPFVKYWIHFNHLLVNGEKMSKSLGNMYTVVDIKKKGFHPLTLRYLYLQTHYRQEMNFTFDALKAAERSLKDLWDLGSVFGKHPHAKFDREPSKKVLKRWEEFQDHMNHDLNTSAALASLHLGIKERADDLDLIFLLSKADEVLGLDLVEQGRERHLKNTVEIPDDVVELVTERERLRKERKFGYADVIRKKVEKMGYEISDNAKGKPTVKKI